MNNSFGKLTDGKKVLSFERLCEIREFVAQNQVLCKRLFDIFMLLNKLVENPKKVKKYSNEEEEEQEEEGISFLNFLKACSIFSRGSLEEQLVILFFFFHFNFQIVSSSSL